MLGRGPGDQGPKARLSPTKVLITTASGSVKAVKDAIA